jgi:hypothetical protein
MAEALPQPGTPEWGDSTSWQYWVIDTVKRYEQDMAFDRHPMGMTMQPPRRRQRTTVDSPAVTGFSPRPEAPGPVVLYLINFRR